MTEDRKALLRCMYAVGFAFAGGILLGKLTATTEIPKQIVYVDTTMPDSVERNYTIGLNCVLDQYREGKGPFFDCDEECEAAGPGEGPAAACEAGRLVGSAWAYEGFAP